ncbi:carboxylesterase, partial [Enterococcus faecalis]
NQPDLTDTSVLLSLGEHDSIVPLPESMRVIQLFQNHGATVQEVCTQSHQLTYQEIKETQTWLAHLST